MISLRDVVTGFGARDPLAEVWRRSLRGGGGGAAEITGVPPLRYIGDGRPLTDYLISGNTIQDGTPSPDAPVDATGCGVRTGNLFDKSTTQNGYYIDDADGKMKYSIGYVGVLSASDYIDIANASSIFITDTSRSKWGAYYDISKTYVSGFNGYGSKSVPSTARYVRITVPNAELDSMMLNLGSTPLPYEPYGYKLDISSGGENLFDTDNRIALVGYIDNSGTIVSNSANACVVCKVEPGTSYTVSADMICTNGNRIAEFSEKPVIGSKGTVLMTKSPPNLYLFTITTGQNTKYIAFHRGASTESERTEFYNKIMLNFGNTAKPYSPYNRITTPIYLGQAESTRRVKKLVLTGEEGTWKKSTAYQGSFYNTLLDTPAYTIPILCSHAVYTQQITPTLYVYGKCTVDGSGDIKNLNLFIGEPSWSVSDFQQYLAAQYAAGTPVTVWYVLAEPETAVVNEPLMKIGDYADTISFAQSGVTIPTINGENVLDVPTTVPPSEVTIKGGIRDV